MVKFKDREAIYWCALISGLIGTGTAAFIIWFICAFAQGRITNPLEWLLVLFPLYIVAIALKWPFIGGLLLILEGTFLICISLVVIESYDFQWLLIPTAAGLLFLVSGVLFILSWRERRKHRRA